MEAVKITGEWTGYALAPEVQERDHVIGQLRAISKGETPEPEARRILADLTDREILRGVVKHHNLVPTVGRGVLARRLSGDTTYTGAINYIAVGTGTTAFTNASLLLNKEVFRKLVSSAAYDENIAYIDGFIASADVSNQTFTEAAAFIDGSTGSTTGQAFSLVIQSFTKSGSMFLSLKVTFT